MRREPSAVGFGAGGRHVGVTFCSPGVCFSRLSLGSGVFVRLRKQAQAARAEYNRIVAALTKTPKNPHFTPFCKKVSRHFSHLALEKASFRSFSPDTFRLKLRKSAIFARRLSWADLGLNY